MSRAAALLALVLAACNGGLGPLPRVPEVDADTLRTWLARAPGPLILDVRGPAAFAAGHLPGAVNVTVDQVEPLLAAIRPRRSTPIVAVCPGGTLSTLAARAALRRGFDAYSLRGGLATWTGPLETGAAPVAAHAPPTVRAGRAAEWMVALVGLGLKPGYMLLALAIVAVLWRARGRGPTLIKQALVAFFVGEAACAVNFAAAGGISDSLELAHGLGMVAWSVLLPWGLFVLLDERVLGYEDPDATCVLRRFCGRCWKKDAVPCGLQRLFLVVAPAAALVALIPWTAPLDPVTVVVPILGSQVVFATPLAQQLLELRLYPALGAAALGAAFLVLLLGRRGYPAAKRLFFVGLGFAAFSLLRFFLFTAFGRNAPWWSDFWEESTEAAAILGVAVLVVTFRRQLGVLGAKATA